MEHCYYCTNKAELITKTGQRVCLNCSKRICNKRKGKKMSGTIAGGKLASKTNIERYGKDFYKKIGAVGGKKGRGLKGFASNRELARIAGRKGGLVSSRSKVK